MQKKSYSTRQDNVLRVTGVNGKALKQETVTLN